MARMLAVIMAALFVLAVFISPAAAKSNKYIGYPAIARGGIPNQKTPPIPANPYDRGCEPSQGCRIGEAPNSYEDGEPGEGADAPGSRVVGADAPNSYHEYAY